MVLVLFQMSVAFKILFVLCCILGPVLKNSLMTLNKGTLNIN